MNYKQKYEEAIERCKSWIRGEHPECFTEAQKAGEFIFPELRESEDERIRKEIIKSIQDNMCVIHKDKCLAWLEKQATPQLRTGPEWVNTIDDACDKLYSEEYAHGEYCHEQSFKWGFEEGVEWLEKQGEQKLTDEEMIRILRTEYEKGRFDMREEMMKDAVEGVVHHFPHDELAAVHYNDPKGTPMSIYVSSKGLSAGDRVKIIIVKEKEEK